MKITRKQLREMILAEARVLAFPGSEAEVKKGRSTYVIAKKDEDHPLESGLKYEDPETGEVFDDFTLQNLGGAADAKGPEKRYSNEYFIYKALKAEGYEEIAYEKGDQLVRKSVDVLLFREMR